MRHELLNSHIKGVHHPDSGRGTTPDKTIKCDLTRLMYYAFDGIGRTEK